MLKEYLLNIKIYLHADVRCITHAPLLAGLLLTFALGGCTNTDATRISAKDTMVAIPEMRVAVNFDHVKEAASLHAGHAIELSVTKGRGSASQSLESGQAPILVGQTKTTFTAPQQLRNEFAFTYSEIAWRRRMFFKEGRYGIEWSVGLGESTVDMKVSSDTQVATEKFISPGIRGGAGLIYSMGHGNSFQVRGFIFKSAESSMNRVELVYTKTLLDNLRLRAGFGGGNISGYNFLRSDYKFEFIGPLLALDLEF